MSVRALALLAFSVSVLGCDGPPATPKAVVRGKLLDGGKPFSLESVKIKLPKGTSLPPGTKPLQITFMPEEKGEMYITTITDPATGGFELAGTDGKGVPLGKYKVGVQVNTGPGTPDALGGKYAPDKTTIQVELKAGEEVIVDINKPK